VPTMRSDFPFGMEVTPLPSRVKFYLPPPVRASFNFSVVPSHQDVPPLAESNPFFSKQMHRILTLSGNDPRAEGGR
jgi:hypothetical protein